jgi:hypothetical protein
MDERLSKLENKVDKIDERTVRMEEQAKLTHSLLQIHDAKGAKALEKAVLLENRLDLAEAKRKAPVEFIMLVGKVATALAAIYGVYRIFI